MGYLAPRGLLLALFIAACGPTGLARAQSAADLELKALNDKSLGLQNAGKLNEALPYALKFENGVKARFGDASPQYATAINNLAEIFRGLNRHGEAEPLYRKALEIDLRRFGPEHPKIAIRLNNLALTLKASGRWREAEPLYMRAVAIDMKAQGATHPSVARDLSNLGALFLSTFRLTEAEEAFRHALDIYEKNEGLGSANVALVLNNLAIALATSGQYLEAERFLRRALSIDEKIFGPDHPDIGGICSNLAEVLRLQGHLHEALPVYLRAAAIEQKAFGNSSANLGIIFSNLGVLYQDTGDPSEAETVYRRALEINEATFGKDHPNTAIALNNLGSVFATTGRERKAEEAYKRALAIDETAFGPDHPSAGIRLSNLASLYEDEGRWDEAVKVLMLAKPILIAARFHAEPRFGHNFGKAVLQHHADGLKGFARALYHAGPSDRARLAEAFEIAQFALQSTAADALASMSARFAKESGALASLVRQDQDLRNALEQAYGRLDFTISNGDAATAAATRPEITKLEADLAAAEARLRQDFPDYDALQYPRPLALADAQHLLQPNQVLILFLDVPKTGKPTEETLVFALTRDRARWVSVPFGPEALGERVMALRCGLDLSLWTPGEAKRDICVKLLQTDASGSGLPPFDAGKANELYQALFGEMKDFVAGNSLLIVPSGPLTALPFEVLVTEQPKKDAAKFEAYTEANFLGAQKAITVLPSVASLSALSLAAQSKAPLAFIGFGNPLLIGADGADRSAFRKQTCAAASPAKMTLVASRALKPDTIFRSGGFSLEALRRQPPLPETADELCATASSLGVSEDARDRVVFLGARATVSAIKAMSRSGELSKARVIHFATHGLLASETAFFDRKRPEAALVLTPPPTQAPNADDNGLLTASEVAGLHLDADFVVMSACNSAAGDAKDAQALSGLARAFFYAGARALLVSHWPVNSNAAVAITTGTVSVLKHDPNAGLAEALRRSLSALIASGGENAHPSVWAPFVLVGNGGR